MRALRRSGIFVQTVTEFANAWSFSPAPTKGMLPSVFGENLFDDSLSDFFGFGRMMPQISSELYGKHAKNLMKTDVRELDGSYELDVDLPGFKKDEVTVDLQDGYLTISAEKALDKDESDQRASSCVRSVAPAR